MHRKHIFISKALIAMLVCGLSFCGCGSSEVMPLTTKQQLNIEEGISKDNQESTTDSEETSITIEETSSVKREFTTGYMESSTDKTELTTKSESSTEKESESISKSEETTKKQESTTKKKEVTTKEPEQTTKKEEPTTKKKEEGANGVTLHLIHPELNEQAKQTAKDIAARIIAKNMSEFDKVRAIHDYLVNTVQYAFIIPDFSSNPDVYTAVGAFDGVAVCQGYTEAFSLLCYYAGIQSHYVIGTGNNFGHSWNIVRINQKWYHVDVTWDDPVDLIDLRRYDYFLISDQQIMKDHTIESYSEKHTCTDNETYKEFRLVETAYANLESTYEKNEISSGYYTKVVGFEGAKAVLKKAVEARQEVIRLEIEMPTVMDDDYSDYFNQAVEQFSPIMSEYCQGWGIDSGLSCGMFLPLKHLILEVEVDIWW